MSEIKVDTLTGKTTANDITVTVGASATMSLEQGLIKSWQRSNVVGGTPSIIESLNTASVADNGTGDYTYSYTSDMSSTTYGVAGNVNEPSGVACFNNATSFTTSTYRVIVQQHANTDTDPNFLSNCIFGDLA